MLMFLSIWSKLYSKEFRFDYDYCAFRNDDSRLFLEFYYSFYQNQLIFIKTDNGFEADGVLNIDIFDKNLNKTIVQQTFKVPVNVFDTAGYNKNNTLTGQINILLDSGQYVFDISATDYNNPIDSANYEDKVNLSRFSENNLIMSCIQLSTKIEKSSDTKSVFYKNTLDILPNPIRLFGKNLSKLYYYFELYNIRKEFISENYSIISKITDLNDNEIKSDTKKYKINHDSKVEYGYFDVSDLKTNSYKLIIEVLNDKDSDIVKNQKKFIIFNSDSNTIANQPAKDDYLLSEYAKYTEQQVNEEFGYAVYLANDIERDQFDMLKTIESKRKFMFLFWKGKNVAKNEYFERMKYSNQNFRSDFSPGWKTDRGRVYCTYGKPDNIDRFPYEPDQRAYEIWNYDRIQGGVMFVFADLTNATGNFGLVNSTAQNEFRDDNWKDKLRIK